MNKSCHWSREKIVSGRERVFRRAFSTERVYRRYQRERAGTVCATMFWSQGLVPEFSLGSVSGSVMGSVSGVRLRTGLEFDLWLGLVDGVRVSVEKEEW